MFWFEDVQFANGELFAEMREWVRDCADCYTDITAEEIDDVPDRVILAIVRRDYDGGLDGFIRDSL